VKGPKLGDFAPGIACSTDTKNNPVEDCISCVIAGREVKHCRETS